MQGLEATEEKPGQEHMTEEEDEEETESPDLETAHRSAPTFFLPPCLSQHGLLVPVTGKPARAYEFLLDRISKSQV